MGFTQLREKSVNEAPMTWKQKIPDRHLQEVVNAVDEDADGARDGGHHHDAGSHHPDHLPVSGLHGRG